MPSINVLSLSD